MALYVTSDIHGAEADFHKLLALAGFGEDDTLYVLGDVVDRNGDGGIDLLKWMMNQPNVELLRGNHESMLLACRFLFNDISGRAIRELTGKKLEHLQHWMRNGAACTLESIKKLHDEDPELLTDLVDYLMDCPLYEGVSVGDRDYVLVHSGLGGYAEGKKLKDYKPVELLWNRPTPEDTYSREFHTILGHTPTFVLDKEYRGRMYATETWTDIDVGAAAGLPPMLLRLDDMKEFYL